MTFLPIDNLTEEQKNLAEVSPEDTIKRRKGVIKIKDDLYYEVIPNVPDTIQNCKDSVTIYSCGLNYFNCVWDSRQGIYKRHFAHGLYNGLRLGNIKGPAIVFEYVCDARRSFNFGQEQDVACLELVYEELIKKHSQASVVLQGGCKGGMTILRFLAERAGQGKSFENIKAAIASHRHSQ